ncbi:protein RETICULATA-RELATED 4, chloroplastic [Cocos nucifera]|uniref:Protein RETICULATA-RELATED 4, chloroplastic n=1 Tax=Cocos nucifera TaxID=13894 RepID=A0A8K0NAL4_COCNU|nr:protein RETICULATA-RELATED 4, chloroplastic [Cocos nucifera]
MAAAASAAAASSNLRFPSNPHRSSRFQPPSSAIGFISPAPPPRLQISLSRPARLPLLAGSGGTGGGGGGLGNTGGGGGGEDGDSSRKNQTEALLALTELGRSLDTLPKDLAAAVEAGRIPGEIVHRFAELEKSPIFRWLLQFGGFKERLLADDLFLAKVAMECGVGVFTKVKYFGMEREYDVCIGMYRSRLRDDVLEVWKLHHNSKEGEKKIEDEKLTAAEWERRRENFFKELDFVVADVAMAIVADFMLVWLPAPTVSLRPPLAFSAGPIAKFFYSCPDNAFQVSMAGTSYSFLQRVGAIVRNGSKLFAVGTGASLIGVGVTNALIKARKALDKNFAGEVEDVPILSTSIAYGVYMAVSSNLRWVDYARWVGIQKIRE